MTRMHRSIRKPMFVVMGCFIGLIIGCMSKGNAASGMEPIKADLYSILSSPAAYDGQLVDVKGFVCLKTDNTALLFSYRYCDAPEGKVGIGLRVDTKSFK